MMYALSALLLAACGAGATDVLQADFASDSVGPYSRAECQRSFPGVTWDNGLTGQSRASIAAGGDTAGSGHSLRIFYPAGSLGPTGTDSAPASGAQWKAYFGGTSDTMYARYRVFFPDSFEWTLGGKLPGLCGSQCNTCCGGKPTGSDGWSARLMWRAGASLVQYVTFVGEPDSNAIDWPWKAPDGSRLVVTTGRWHELQVRVALNTPGTDGGPGLADGRITGWYDGAVALDTGNLRLRDRDTMHVDHFYFSTFYGGSLASFEPAHDNRLFFDDFAVSDSFIPLHSAASGIVRRDPTAPRLTGTTLRYGAGWAGRTLLVRDLEGRLQARLALTGTSARLPAALPTGIELLSVPGTGWSGATTVTVSPR
jgi:hypothetical protein